MLLSVLAMPAIRRMLPGPRSNDACDSARNSATMSRWPINRYARILWAIMTKGDAFDARHVSVKPGTPSLTLAPGG